MCLLGLFWPAVSVRGATVCDSVTFNPSFLTFDANGGTRIVNFSLPDFCRWAINVDSPWVKITAAPTIGYSSGGFTLVVEPNSFSQRTASVSIMSSSLTITQSAGSCTVTTVATPLNFGANGGTGVLRLSPSTAACAWRAYSLVPWLRVASPIGQGPSGDAFFVATNSTSAPRTGQISFEGQVLTVSQDAGPAMSPGTPVVYGLSTFAGGGPASLPNRGDGGPALGAYFSNASGLAFDKTSGNIYVGDDEGIRVITPDGKINYFAGGGTATGDNIPASTANLHVDQIAVDTPAAVYAGCPTQHICKVANGIVKVVAGNGSVGITPCCQFPATSAPFFALAYVNVGPPPGSFYFTDFGQCGVYRVTAGIAYRIGGACASDMAVDDSGAPYVISYDTSQIWKFVDGGHTVIAGLGSGGDGSPALSAKLSFPYGLRLAANGDFFLLDNTQQSNSLPPALRKISAADSTISTIAGNGVLGNFYFEDLAVDSAGSVYFTEFNGSLVRKLTPIGSFCNYSASAPATQPISGGPLNIPVTASAACGWSVSSDVPWITVTAASGSGSDNAQVALASNAGQPARSGTIYVAGQAIQINQAAGIATLSLSTNLVAFGMNGNLSTGPQKVFLTVASTAVAWTTSSNQPNITVAPASGTSSSTLTITAAAGASGVITISAPGAYNPTLQIAVNVATVVLAPPFGSFDTPVNLTTGIAGAIPVTGWALDNVQVSKVDIWREPFGTEPVAANGLVYIGDAVIVAGARPDVQTTFPNTPANYQAGWGYMFLTNFLPNGSGPAGNGTYRLHAIAHNVAGLSKDLGTKTIYVNNAQASKPFGTIDTPSQGGTISGSAYTNAAWALTQNPSCIPNDGSTLTVYVDGQALPGHPFYNNKRNDIASFFPGLCNSNGAIGNYTLDTTQMTNGVHTIFWIAFDDHNRGDGLGSRYLNVFNTGTAGTAQASEDPIDPPDAKFQNGPVNIEAEELDRLELKLGAISGYSQINGERAPLPIGSSLKRGTFYWHLGPGFTSNYSLVFQRLDGTQILMNVRVRPKTFQR